MRVTFLGTGTSTGVPVVGCRCRICTSGDPKNQRLRQSVKIEANDRVFLIDTTPDLRLQLLRDPIPRLDFILFTHSHADHVMGLDDVRPFNFFQRRTLVAYANPLTAKAIRRAFSYIWDPNTQVGGGKPQIELREVEGAFEHEGIRIVPIPVRHGDWTILGYRIGPFAYITDTNGIPASSMRLLEGSRSPGARRPPPRAAAPDPFRHRRGDRGGEAPRREDDVSHPPDPRHRPRNGRRAASRRVPAGLGRAGAGVLSARDPMFRQPTSPNIQA